MKSPPPHSIEPFPIPPELKRIRSLSKLLAQHHATTPIPDKILQKWLNSKIRKRRKNHGEILVRKVLVDTQKNAIVFRLRQFRNIRYIDIELYKWQKVPPKLYFPQKAKHFFKCFKRIPVYYPDHARLLAQWILHYSDQMGVRDPKKGDSWTSTRSKKNTETSHTHQEANKNPPSSPQFGEVQKDQVLISPKEKRLRILPNR